MLESVTVTVLVLVSVIRSHLLFEGGMFHESTITSPQ